MCRNIAQSHPFGGIRRPHFQPPGGRSGHGPSRRVVGVIVTIPLNNSARINDHRDETAENAWVSDSAYARTIGGHALRAADARQRVLQDRHGAGVARNRVFGPGSLRGNAPNVAVPKQAPTAEGHPMFTTPKIRKTGMFAR